MYLLLHMYASIVSSQLFALHISQVLEIDMGSGV